MTDDTEFCFFMGLILFIVLVIIYAAKTSHENRTKHNKTAQIPLSEVRCSDLERAIDECEASDDVALCRGRYDVKIAMCFRGQ